jgi:hypothetical protein
MARILVESRTAVFRILSIQPIWNRKKKKIESYILADTEGLVYWYDQREGMNGHLAGATYSQNG